MFPLVVEVVDLYTDFDLFAIFYASFDLFVLL